MKKTLLALAVLAASGAAFAQSATLSGSYAAGFQSTNAYDATAKALVKNAGFGTDTAAIALTATEDLGGGLKATAKVSLGGMMRDGAGTGEDAFVSLAGGFGTITFATVESDDGLSRAYAGAPVIGLDGKVHGGNSNIDVFSYTTPQLAPGLTAYYAYVDRGPSAASRTGLASGTTGAASNQPSHTARVTYTAGPIDARFDVTSWTRQGDALVASNTTKNRFRISGNYDLGMVKLGLGYASTKRTTGSTVKQTEAGLSAPVGPVTLGLVYEKQVDSAGATASGVTFGAQYNLSKRTNVSAGLAQWKVSNQAANANQSSFRVLVGHSF